jgi:hypothetical protein
MKPKHQPGEYLSLRWEYGDPDEVYVYGHVDLPTFLGEVAAYLDGSVESLDFGHFPVLGDVVRHRWARFLRSGSDSDGKPTTTLHEFREPGPGRFKITAMTPEKWIRFDRCARTVMGEDGEASCWIREGHTGPCQPWTPPHNRGE